MTLLFPLPDIRDVGDRVVPSKFDFDKNGRFSSHNAGHINILVRYAFWPPAHPPIMCWRFRGQTLTKVFCEIVRPTHSCCFKTHHMMVVSEFETFLWMYNLYRDFQLDSAW